MNLSLLTESRPGVFSSRQFKNALIAILLVATALSVFLGHGAEAIAIALIVPLPRCWVLPRNIGASEPWKRCVRWRRQRQRPCVMVKKSSFQPVTSSSATSSCCAPATKSPLMPV